MPTPERGGSTLPPVDALSAVLIETEYVSNDISADECGDCGQVATGSRARASG